MGLFTNWFNRTTTPEFYDRKLVSQFLDDLGLTNKKSDIEQIAMLYTVILKRAEVCSQVKFTHVINDKPQENSEIVNLINNPNDFQTFKEFIYQYVFYLSIHGVANQEKLELPGFGIDKTMLLNLDPSYTTIPDYNYNDYKSGKVKPDYIYDYGTGLEKIPSENIITFFDDTQKSNNLLKGTSKTKAGELIFTNSQLRLEADNVLTDKPGGIGVLSTSNKNIAGVSVSMSPAEKKELHKELKRYGVSKGKRHIILTAAALDYLPLANPIKDWDLFKNTERDFILAANLFQQPKEFYMANAKYNDKVAAEIKYYSGDPLSTMTIYANKILKYFGGEGEILASYDHVPVMQAKLVERANYLKLYFESLKLALDLGGDEKLIKDKVDAEL